jgi:hypothetical protein
MTLLCVVASHDCLVRPPSLAGLLSHAEPNDAGCRAAFGRRGSLKGSRTFLANGRNKHFAIVARDGISRSFRVAQSACLPGLTLRARWSWRAGRACFTSSALWARRSLLPGTSLWASWARRARRTLRTGWPLRAGSSLRTGRPCRPLTTFTSSQQDGGEHDNDTQSAHTDAPCCPLQLVRFSTIRVVRHQLSWVEPFARMDGMLGRPV